jgi:hypothetical protein
MHDEIAAFMVMGYLLGAYLLGAVLIGAVQGIRNAWCKASNYDVALDDAYAKTVENACERDHTQ